MKFLKYTLKVLAGIIALALSLFVIMVIVPETETVKSIQPRKSTKYWKMSEGFKIAYTHLKSQDLIKKSPIVYLHGGPGGYIHSSVINALSEFTESGHDVYLYDQRGSGLSDRLEKFSDISIKKHIKDLTEIVSEKINQEKVILIGHSFGANIIAHYSVNHSDRVHKMIFSSPGELLPMRMVNKKYVDLDSVYPKPDTLKFKMVVGFVPEVDIAAIKPKSIIAGTAMLTDVKLVSDKQMDRLLNTLFTKVTKGMVCDTLNIRPEEGGAGLYAFIASNNDDVPDIRGKIKKLKIPVLVIQGQCDYVPYSYAIEYAKLYPNGNYRLIEDAGHIIVWEQEEKYIKSIKEFLK
ncbi:alpha/beta hydrolase [uncultured Croceitalea sp.]|uniref:alpha/beta fold hydrolase n=1 Tax=uncultured Croceitalea sp. TaxID=1798908 RepID=UPI00330661AC